MPAFPLEILRPFLWIALAAFFTGFAAYMVAGLGGSSYAMAGAPQPEPAQVIIDESPDNPLRLT